MKKLLVFLVPLCTFVLAGCGAGGGLIDKPAVHPPLKDQPLSQSELENLQFGQKAWAVVERIDGSGRSALKFEPIELGNRLDWAYLTFRDEKLRFGPGDSGSPVIDSNGKTIGAISGTYGSDNVVITAITAMKDPVGLQSFSDKQGMLICFAKGFSREEKQQLRQKTGLPISNLDPGRIAYQDRGTGELSAGKSAAVLYIDGPLVSFYSVGSVTHRADKQLLAFGHPLEWLGELDKPMPVKAARVVQFVNGPLLEGRGKQAVPIGGTAGALVQDRERAVLIDEQITPSCVEVEVNVEGKASSHQFAITGVYDEEIFLVGLGAIVRTLRNTILPAYFEATVEVVEIDGRQVYELGTISWPHQGGAVWEVVRDSYSSANKIIISLN